MYNKEEGGNVPSTKTETGKGTISPYSQYSQKDREEIYQVLEGVKKVLDSMF